MPAENLQQQTYTFRLSLPRGTWRWEVSVDLSQAAPTYRVQNVQTPWGILRDTVAIPGEVIQAMASGIEEVMTAFIPGIVLGPVTSLVFDVDEGRGPSLPQTITVTNSGPYGSLLQVNLSTSAGFLQATPSTLGGLSSSEAGSFDLTVDGTELLNASSPYTAQAIVESTTASNSPQIVDVTVNVRPKATIALSASLVLFYVTNNLGYPYPPVPTQQIVLQNTGSPQSLLEYKIQRVCGCSDWLVSFSPSYGQIPGGSSQTITLQVAPDDTMGPGIYEETLRISGYSTNSYQDVIVRLQIL